MEEESANTVGATDENVEGVYAAVEEATIEAASDETDPTDGGSTAILSTTATTREQQEAAELIAAAAADMRAAAVAAQPLAQDGGGGTAMITTAREGEGDDEMTVVADNTTLMTTTEPDVAPATTATTTTTAAVVDPGSVATAVAVDISMQDISKIREAVELREKQLADLKKTMTDNTSTIKNLKRQLKEAKFARTLANKQRKMAVLAERKAAAAAAAGSAAANPTLGPNGLPIGQGAAVNGPASDASRNAAAAEIATARAPRGSPGAAVAGAPSAGTTEGDSKPAMKIVAQYGGGNKKSGSRIREQKWKERFQDLVAFKLQYGHCIVPKSYKDKSLHHWVRKQRVCKKDFDAGICGPEAMTTERMEALDSIGFAWVVGHQPKDDVWDANFQQLITFRQKHGHFRIPATMQKLHKWVLNQRCRRRLLEQKGEGKARGMTWARVEKLDAIGFVWDGKKGY